MFDVGRTGLSTDLRQFLAALEFVKAFNPGLDLELGPAHRYRSYRSTARQHNAGAVRVDIFVRCSLLALVLLLEEAPFQTGSQRILWRYGGLHP
jgi:hypothetical protein